MSAKVTFNFIIILLVFSSSFVFLMFRAMQFDRNYPDPLPTELSAQTVRLDESIQEDYRCFLPADSGECLGYSEKYYFNRDRGTCEMYVYGGCGAEVPFNSLQECELTCVSN
jgi:hypothetical protein